MSALGLLLTIGLSAGTSSLFAYKSLEKSNKEFTENVYKKYLGYVPGLPTKSAKEEAEEEVMEEVESEQPAEEVKTHAGVVTKVLLGGVPVGVAKEVETKPFFKVEDDAAEKKTTKPAAKPAAKATTKKATSKKEK